MEKLAMLEKRYNVFTWMLTLDDVVHDSRTNKVHAPDCVWDYILKTHSIAHTYRMDGEPKFAALTTIFGRANSTEDNEVLVVSPGASEGHDEHNRNNGKHIIIIDDDSTSVEIVNSPPGKCNGKSKAKRINFRQTSLWDYVEYDSDHSLNTQFSTANTTLKSNSITLEQARTKSSIPSCAKVKGKMVTSSCASNHP